MKAAGDFSAAVAAYWEDPQTKSIIDRNLHELEMQAVCRYLQPLDRLIDLGCGDGAATVRYAEKVKECMGVERSEHLRKRAEENAGRSGRSNINIVAGDILAPAEDWGRYDAAVTQRLLINLVSREDQQQGICNIHRLLKPGGRYIMIENTNDGFGALNDMRAAAGLDPIGQHWHNRFFDYEELTAFMKGKFQLLHFQDFGLYYFLTRVYVPMFAEFTGYGAQAVKDPIFELSDAQARRLYEQLRERFEIKGCRALGPIQVFVFRREGGELDGE
ncbi:MAG: hypothetical protein AMJ79_14415 [Phycisphaerae bacterium SM23_30]|nr:MAG: hypothetical protein AMJ79_14415 [Phycisphaerae bacterium SM23_30]